MICMICDDQKRELENIRQSISEYARQRPELSLEIKCFQSPLDMIDEMNKSGTPDIAVLDICMPGILGTEIAREIQGRSEEGCDIIFLTTSPDFAVEAFSLRVKDYLIKPYTRERLTDTLDRIMENRRRRRYAPIRCGSEIHRIDLYSVIYAEARNHSTEIYLKSGRRLTTRMTLTELRELFQGINGFIPVGASYLVNLRCAQKLSSNGIEMINGQEIPVPRRHRNQLKQQYFDFYTGEATGK